MGLHFRKSVQLFPGFRVNFSKHGIGFSAGGRGLRYSHSATGRRTVSTSIPGTGLSWSQSLNSTKKHRSASKKQTSHRSISQAPEHFSETSWGSASPVPEEPANNPLPIILAILALFAACSPVWLIGIVLAIASALMFVAGNQMGMRAMAPKWSVALIILAIICACNTATGGTTHTTTTAESPVASTAATSSTANPTNTSVTPSAVEASSNTTETKSLQETVQPLSEAVGLSEAEPATENVSPASPEEITDEQPSPVDEGDAVTNIDVGAGDDSQEPADAQTFVNNGIYDEVEEQEPYEDPGQMEVVYISASGNRYHRNPNCSGMNNPRAVSIAEAEAEGRTPCQKCY